MLCEVLRGLEGERAARADSMFGLWPESVCGCRGTQLPLLHRRGITIRKTSDMLIGTWCIENRLLLLLKRQ